MDKEELKRLVESLAPKGWYTRADQIKPLKDRITYSNPDIPNELKDEVCAILTPFIDGCHIQYFAFIAGLLGIAVFHQQRKDEIKDVISCGITHTQEGKATIYSAFGTKVAEMNHHKSIDHSMRSYEFENLTQASQRHYGNSSNVKRHKGGKFEDLHAKSFIVLVFSLWEDNFRVQIANKLPINEKENDRVKRVKSNLMGDIRHIRNYIVHPSVCIEELNELKLLPKELWREMTPKGITEVMAGVLKEQINAIEIEICNIPECKCSQNSDVRCLGMLATRD